MKKFILLFLIIALTIAVGCSNESSNQNEAPQIDVEFTEDEEMSESDYFTYEETETNIVKTEEKSKTNEIKTVSKINETKTEKVKTENNETIEKTEVETNEITIEDKSDVEKIVYISKSGKKYHLETCRTLRGEKETIDLNEAITMGYEACKVCNPDNVESE